jgi:hypothetical protein
MKTVERKAASEEASDEQKVALGSHRDIFLASRIHPQYNGTAPDTEGLALIFAKTKLLYGTAETNQASRLHQESISTLFRLVTIQPQRG